MLPEQVAAGEASSIAAQAVANASGNPDDGAAAAAAAAAAATAAAATTPPSAFAAEEAEEAAREAEMERLEAEAKAGQQGTAATAAPAADTTSATAAVTSEAGTAAASKASKSAEQAAIIALRRKATEQAAIIARQNGEIAAYKDVATSRGSAAPGDGTQSGQQGQQAELTVEQQLDDVDARFEALATEYDNGRISATEWAKGQNELGRERRELEKAEAQALIEQAALEAANSPRHNPVVRERTENLLVDYPILGKIVEPGHWDDLRAAAQLEAKAEGKPLLDNSPESTLELRQRMANIAERWWDKPAYTARQQRAAAQPGQQPGKAAPGSAAPTAAQREAKLTLAAQMPPDIGNRGAPASGSTNFEEMERQYGAMNEDQRIRFADANPAFVAHMTGLPVGR